jgi:hypothetical protein
VSLAIFFIEDVGDRLTALAQANDRALALALRFGADPELARLAWEVYTGALADVGVSFGLRRADLVLHLGNLSYSELSIRKERR